MNIGDRASVTRAFSDDEIGALAALAQAGGWRVAHVPEPLITGLFSYLLGVELPGFGTNYLKQETSFQASAAVGERLTATVEITRLRPDKHLCDLATTCTGADGRTIATGRALVLVRDVGKTGQA